MVTSGGGACERVVPRRGKAGKRVYSARAAAHHPLNDMGKPLKLQQGQIWKHGEQFFRIVRLERLAVEYKLTSHLASRGGKSVQATKKEFCRLIKQAELLPAAPVPVPRAVGPE